MKRDKYISFLESLKTDSNEKLIDIIIEGYGLIEQEESDSDPVSNPERLDILRENGFSNKDLALLIYKMRRETLGGRKPGLFVWNYIRITEPIYKRNEEKADNLEASARDILNMPSGNLFYN